MARPTKQQIAAVRSALREIHAELLAWDPHILVAFSGQEQKAQIIARVKQLGWQYIHDPGNETADVSMVEFSLDATASAETNTAVKPGHKARRVKFPASFFASLGIIFSIVGVLVAVTTVYTDHRARQLHDSGTQTTGEIEGTYFNSNRGNRIYYVSYRFADTHGGIHKDENSYPFGDWSNLRPGDPISITYMADNPQRNDLTQRIADIVSRNLKDEMALVGWPWIVSGCFFLGYLARKRGYFGVREIR